MDLLAKIKDYDELSYRSIIETLISHYSSKKIVSTLVEVDVKYKQTVQDLVEKVKDYL